MASRLEIRALIVSVLGMLLMAPFNALATDLARQHTAPEQGSFLLRVMALEILPVGVKSEIPTIGGSVDVPRKSIVGGNLSYFLTRHWAVELQGGPFERTYRITDSALGSFDIGSISNIAVSLTLQYHLYPQAQWSPYLGLGVNHAWVRQVKPAAGIPDFKVRDVTSAIVGAGLDYRLDARWTVSTSAQYILSPEYRFQGQGFNATLSMNSLVVGAGVGLRF